MGRDETHGMVWECEAECDKETQQAIHVVLETGDAWWIPKSVVHDDSEVFEFGGEGKLVLHYWWAERSGLV